MSIVSCSIVARNFLCIGLLRHCCSCCSRELIFSIELNVRSRVLKKLLGLTPNEGSRFPIYGRRISEAVCGVFYSHLRFLSYVIVDTIVRWFWVVLEWNSFRVFLIFKSLRSVFVPFIMPKIYDIAEVAQVLKAYAMFPADCFDGRIAPTLSMSFAYIYSK